MDPERRFLTKEGRATAFSEAAVEFDRLKAIAHQNPDDSAVRLEAANAAVRYVNELAIADRHGDVGPTLEWLADLTLGHPEDRDLAVVAATGSFDHICNLGVAERFEEAIAELARLKAFVARYPHDPQVGVRADSASENLAGMMGWDDSVDFADDDDGIVGPVADDDPTRNGTG